MKKLSLILIATILISCSKTTTSEVKAQDTKSSENIVYVYNFHSTHRCATCVAIEKATTNALKQNFATELESEKIQQISINVDDDKNAKLAEKFQAFGTSLYIFTKINNKEIIIDLTEKAFLYARNNEEKFIKIISEEISKLL